MGLFKPELEMHLLTGFYVREEYVYCKVISTLEIVGSNYYEISVLLLKIFY